MDITKGYKTSEFWIVVFILFLWTLQMLGVDLSGILNHASSSAGQVKDLIAQAHSNDNIMTIVAGVYVVGRTMMKHKVAGSEKTISKEELKSLIDAALKDVMPTKSLNEEVDEIIKKSV